FHETLNMLGELHDRKQADYGVSDDPFYNIRASEQFGIPGWVGAVLRGTDKVRRLEKAARQVVAGEPVDLANEGVEDSLLDLAVYAVIAYVMFTEDAWETV